MNVRVFALILLGFAAGCGTIDKLDDDGFTIVRDAYAFDAREDTWGKIDRRGYQLWSVDGPTLQAIRIFDPVQDGEPLFPSRASDKLPKFLGRMSALEVEEFVVDTLVAAGVTNALAQNLRPQQFADLQGFAFEVSYLGDDGLEYLGHVRGAVHDEELLLILYTGTKAHYYAAHLADVTRMLDSMKRLL